MALYTGMIGEPVAELDTPALVVDLDLMEANVARMVRVFREAGVGSRPHTKGIKIPALAHKLLAAGAFGITCAKLGEAEVMAQAGIRDILIANQIVGAKKVTRLMGLCRQADPMVCVDSAEHVRELDAAAQAWGVRLRVLIEVNVGAERCGVVPGEEVLALAKHIARCPGLRLMGVQTWESNIVHVPFEQRPAEMERSLGMLLNSVESCRSSGLPMEIVSCGGTADYWLAARARGVTEIEAGGGVFGDRYYQSLGVDHPIAATVLSTVISRPKPTRIVTDAGAKAVPDSPFVPWPRGIKDVQKVIMSMEHGQIELSAPAETPRIGEKIAWEPSYVDFAVNMHDVMYGARQGRVEAIWPILGRGKLQ